MAQAVRRLDGQSLLCQAKAGQKMQCPKNQNNWGIIGHQDAKELTIIWGSDTRYWKWEGLQIGEHRMEVAELINVCWLEINGKYAMKKLTEGMDYQVKFVVKLLNNFNIDKPVTFSLTTPEGCKQEHTENMMAMPRNEIISITAGEFKTPRNNCGCGEVKFSMMNTDGFWKHGMVVIGAVVVPKFI
ncbi:PP2 domain-containing protein [Klebsiella pneumoniae]